MVARTITKKSVRFLERIEDSRQRIFFANHSSHLDFILIWSSLPRHVRKRTRPVARRDYWQSSRFRRYYVGKVFNAVLIDRALLDGDTAADRVDRRGNEAVEQMVQGLGDEYSLILFPEGTRGSGESIGQFRSGLYYLCRARPDVEFVPVRIQGAHKVLPKGRTIPRPQESDLTFGASMRFEPGETRRAFSERMQSSYPEALASSRPLAVALTISTPPPSPDGQVNILFAGVDEPNGRSDTIAVLHVEPNTAARVLFVPRDLWDPVAGNRINQATIDGPQAAVDAVGRTLGIPIDHYVEVDLPGFVALVDASAACRSPSAPRCGTARPACTSSRRPAPCSTARRRWRSSAPTPSRSATRIGGSPIPAATSAASPRGVRSCRWCSSNSVRSGPTPWRSTA